MNTAAKIWMAVAVLLFIVIIAMVTMLFTLPGKNSAPVVATSTPQQPTEQVPVTPKPSAEQPLSARVSVSSPQPNTAVGNTFQVQGRAPGNWFFEADFPIQVRDKDQNVIARTYASALGEWMTTELVEFSSNIIIEGGYKGPATLILLKNNPSGLPEYDDAVEIPIILQ